MKKLRLASYVAAGMLAALGAGALAGRLDTRRAADPQPVKASVAEDGYVCPMHHDITDSHPGTCPICGMALVKGHLHGGAEGVHVERAALSDLGVSLVAARRRALDRPLRTYGTIVPDEARTFTVSPKFDGWLRRINLHQVGERVVEGQVLYEIYSPDLVARQREYFAFLNRRRQILQSVGDVSQQENEYVMDLLREWQKQREEFLRMDLGVETVQQLEDTRMTIEVVKVLARHGGIVTRIDAREGSFVTPATPVFTIADTSSVGIDVALYPDQLARVHAGDPVSVSIADGAPAIEAKLDFVSPLAEGGRARARATVAHPASELQLGALVGVTIRTQSRDALVLPSSSVTRTGHGDFVMLSRGGGRFLPIEVRPGIEAGDDIEILRGLREGAQVASNAQFLMDASASMADTRARHESGVEPERDPHQ